MKAAKAEVRIAQLQGMPEAERRAFAFACLAEDRRPSVVQAALAAIGAPRNAPERDAVIDYYRFLDADPLTRDPGGSSRERLLRMLQEAALLPDASILLRAASTYERLPPLFAEEAHALRATGLVLLAAVDTDLAAFHATRLLFDAETAEMSGEPAATAARVLATLGRLEPLYACAMQSRHPEVLAQALPALAQAPLSVVSGVLALHLENPEDAIAAAAWDLLLLRSEEEGATRLRHFLQASDRPPLYRYVAMTIAANRQPWQIDILRETGTWSVPPWQRSLLDAALELLPPQR